jgi:hypothetical protein
MRHFEAPPFWVPGDVNSGAAKYNSESYVNQQQKWVILISTQLHVLTPPFCPLKIITSFPTVFPKPQ